MLFDPWIGGREGGIEVKDRPTQRRKQGKEGKKLRKTRVRRKKRSPRLISVTAIRLFPAETPSPVDCSWKLLREQAQNVLDVTDSDVFMLGAHFPQKLGRDPSHMVLIGRARVSK